MDQDPLVIEQIDAAAIFLNEFGKRFVVLAAFWLKLSEERSWYLYVASDEFNDNSLRVGYREVSRIAGEMRLADFDQFQVKLIPGTDPFAKAAVEYLQLYPGNMPTRLRRTPFGNRYVDEVYIYPNPVPVS